MSRNLERVADLATNIGEDAVFLAEGLDHEPFFPPHAKEIERAEAEQAGKAGDTLGTVKTRMYASALAALSG